MYVHVFLKVPDAIAVLVSSEPFIPPPHIHFGRADMAMAERQHTAATGTLDRVKASTKAVGLMLAAGEKYQCALAASNTAASDFYFNIMSVVRCTKENDVCESDADKLVALVGLLKAQNAAIGILAREIQSEVVVPIGSVISAAWKGAQDAYTSQLGKESSECRKVCKQADKNAAKLRTGYEKALKKGDAVKAAEKLQQLDAESNEYMRTATMFAEGQAAFTKQLQQTEAVRFGVVTSALTKVGEKSAGLMESSVELHRWCDPTAAAAAKQQERQQQPQPQPQQRTALNSDQNSYQQQQQEQEHELLLQMHLHQQISAIDPTYETAPRHVSSETLPSSSSSQPYDTAHIHEHDRGASEIQRTPSGIHSDAVSDSCINTLRLRHPQPFPHR